MMSLNDEKSAALEVLADAKVAAEVYASKVEAPDFSWLDAKVAADNEQVINAVLYWENKAIDDVEAASAGESFEHINSGVKAEFRQLYFFLALSAAAFSGLKVNEKDFLVA